MQEELSFERVDDLSTQTNLEPPLSSHSNSQNEQRGLETYAIPGLSQ